MDYKFKNVIEKVSREYVPVLCVLMIAGFSGRLIEILLVSSHHGFEIYGVNSFIFGFATDLQLIFLMSLPFTALFYLLKRAGDCFRSAIIATLTGLVTIVSLLLSFYYSLTLVPLGPEFWAYSLNEITDTVIAAESYVELKVVLVILLTIFLITIFYRICKWAVAFSYTVRLSVLGTVLIAIGCATIVMTFSSSQSDQAAANKLSYFIKIGFQQSISVTEEYEPQNNSEYPFLKKAYENDVLGPFFKEISEPPNIVFILVESLGGEFVGKHSQWSGFAPFIDSLAAGGLYWENGLSMSGRTFGMVPSLFGSLPPGEKGFMDLGPDYPAHTSLIRLLGEQGYHTSFYSGYNTYFDGLNYFLDYQDIDFVMSKEWISAEYPNRYETGGNYWGYDDKSLFEVTSTISDTLTANPRLEIYHTLQSHSPFTVPDELEYERKFNERLKNLSVSESKKESFQRYSSELTTLLFTDDALREFMYSYRKRDDYSNTIFIITGDHWLIPVPQTNQISRYHVPIIFYSELIKEPIIFESVNTHANITPAITAFLDRNAGISMPDSVHWIGQTMDTTRSFRNVHSLPLMQNKNQLSDYVSESHFLSNGTLFRISSGLSLTTTSNPEKRAELERSLNQFKSKNTYVTRNNKLYPDSYGSDQMHDYEFITRYSEMFADIDAQGLSLDEQFKLARDYAYGGNYDKARSIAKRLLLEVPDYHDVRILIGRTYAWNREYDKARESLREVQRRDSSYSDTYDALADTEYWSGNYITSLEVINTGLSFHPGNASFLEKKIKVLIALNRTGDAKNTFAELRSTNPSYENLDQLEAQLF